MCLKFNQFSRQTDKRCLFLDTRHSVSNAEDAVRLGILHRKV